jgi:pimeloyl-ACP methyl ester carboxylesterase
MTAPRVKTIVCAHATGLHRIAYYDWGDPQNPQVVLCVHGLTRTGRDFDLLAQRLSKRFRVVCPDVAGRGLSDWLPQPMLYNIAQYTSDMVTLISHLQPTSLRWVGTSMGGLIAMNYAGLVAQAKAPGRQIPPARHSATIDDGIVPISHLVLNDVGPRVEAGSLLRIGQYVGEPASFGSFQEAVNYVKQSAQSFGPHSDAQWEMLTQHYFVPVDGRWVKHYDPAIALAFTGLSQELITQGETILWQAWRAIEAPALVMHGEHSDLLLAATVQQMLASNPLAKLFTAKGVGHAPSLLVEDQLHAVTEFLGSA